jgi:hypothetical protein
LLTGTQRPFFRPKPIFLRALERVDSLTETPATFSRYSRLSASLAKGRASTSASKSLLAFSSSRGFLPGAFPGESERPSRAALARRLSVAFYRGKAHSENASGLALCHAPLL